MKVQNSPASILKNKKLNMALELKQNPLIWALDPSDLNESQVKKMQEVMKTWSQSRQELIGASIFSPFDLGWIMKVKKSVADSTIAQVEEGLREKVSSFGFPGDNVQILPSLTNSLRDRVQTLIEFAKKKKAEVILVGSQARSRSQVTGLGSFSEALISTSSLPVLVVGENVETFQDISKIFFPTDFSSTSLGVFKALLKFAKKFDAEVVLYHYMDLDSGPLAYGIPWGFDIRWVDEYWQNHSKMIEMEAKKWTEICQKILGRPCQYICDRKLGGLSARMLEKAKEERADLIALGVKRGPWSQVILGRIVRTLFSDSRVPVLIIHSHKKKVH